MTETNKLGYIAAYDYTEVLIGINSFFLGAKSVNPDVTMNVVYINSWGDAALEQAAANLFSPRAVTCSPSMRTLRRLRLQLKGRRLCSRLQYRQQQGGSRFLPDSSHLAS